MSTALRRLLLIIAPLLTATLLPGLLNASPQEDYLKRFQAYESWLNTLPSLPSPSFTTFIHQDTPLSKKLREKWLKSLGEKEAWAQYRKDYRPSKRVSLQCYAATADYYTGEKAKAINQAQSIWLSGKTRPTACRALFNLLMQQPDFDSGYLDARISLALDENNPTLVTYLLKQYHPPKEGDIKRFEDIIKHPTHIQRLPEDAFYRPFYLYGLKRLVIKKSKKVDVFWQEALKTHRLTPEQQQQFLAFYAYYLAARNEKTALTIFEQVSPEYYTPPLLEVVFRDALKRLDWQAVLKLTKLMPDKEDPCWLYWQARAEEALGHKDIAQSLYEKVAQNRHYYGFLASLKIQKPLQFELETTDVDLSTLAPYQPVLDEIKREYEQNQEAKASQLLDDFSSELPKDEKIMLIHWVAKKLKWYAKSIDLSSHEDLRNHLVLRFPLAHRDLITKMAHDYHLPEALIYAIIRQESAFNESIGSAAGAKGLMQLMPSTARFIAKRKHVDYDGPATLLTSNANIHLGSAYLQTLSERFENHPVLMAAAYNAGPNQVLYWLKHHPPKAVDIWVETLPWKETRHYLKNVIAFYAVYQYRIREEANIKPALQPIK